MKTLLECHLHKVDSTDYCTNATLVVLRRVLVTIIALLACNAAIAQKTWTSTTAGGSWAVAGNWTGGAPATNDVVVFNASNDLLPKS